MLRNLLDTRARWTVLVSEREATTTFTTTFSTTINANTNIIATGRQQKRTKAKCWLTLQPYCLMLVKSMHTFSGLSHTLGHLRHAHIRQEEGEGQVLAKRAQIRLNQQSFLCLNGTR